MGFVLSSEMQALKEISQMTGISCSDFTVIKHEVLSESAAKQKAFLYFDPS